MAGAGSYGDRAWRVGVTADLAPRPGRDDVETSWGPIGLDALRAQGVAVDFLPDTGAVLTPEAVAGYDAVVFSGPAVDAATVSGERPPGLLARFGVGLDAVDVDACTRAGVAVTNTPDGARRAVATAALTLVLAVRQQLLVKHRLVLDGRWGDTLDHLGSGLTGATVGTVGYGNIARELFDLLRPFATTNLATDPYADAASLADHGVGLVPLETLLRRSDVVVVTAALTQATHHLLDADRLALMPAHAVLVNVARGPIVDTDALVAALEGGRLAGAGLDVVEPEPLPVDHPLTRLPNVVLSPHGLAWTDEMARGNGASVVRSVLAVRDGAVPERCVNPDALAVRRRLDATRHAGTPVVAG